MARTSDKHTPRVDEELSREVAPLTHGEPVDSRAQESREKEDPADGERTPDAIGSSDGDAPPRSLPPNEIERRHDLARFLERKFLATRDEILENAVEMHAPTDVLEQLKTLPPGTYNGFPQVWEALGGKIEGDRHH